MMVHELNIREDHDSLCWIGKVTAKSRRELSRHVKALNWRKDTGCGTDCSGQWFAGSATLLRAYRVGNEWVGVVERTAARDV